MATTASLLPALAGVAGADPTSTPSSSSAVSTPAESSVAPPAPSSATPPAETSASTPTSSSEAPAPAKAEAVAPEAALKAAAADDPWEQSPVYTKWQQLGGAAFAGDLVGTEVVQANGIRYARFSKNVTITHDAANGAHWFSGAIAGVWNGTTNGPDGAISVATMDQVPVSRGFQGGAASAFSNGVSVYYSDAYGAFPISGAMRQKYWAYGSVNGTFGWPTAVENAWADNNGGPTQITSQNFSEAVALFKGPSGVAYWISGALRDKYLSVDGPVGFNGMLTGDQTASAGSGWYVGTETGTIYWSPSTSAVRLEGPINSKFWSEGGPNGRFGYPLADVGKVGDGQYANFTTQVTVFHSDSRGTHWISGALRAKFEALGGVTGSLGFPTSDQYSTNGRDGLYVLFGPNKVILWGANTGAFLVRDQYLAKLRADGDVADYGLPMTEVGPVGPYQFQQFQAATIFDGNGRSTVTLGWDFREVWWYLGGTSSPLGYASSDYQSWGNAQFYQQFDYGYVLCDYNENVCYYDYNGASAKSSKSAVDGAKPDIEQVRREATKISINGGAPRG
ncbi:LGFP repeat-containing protein [Umezawaea endophytica]|uniref:LGFP repeat-containing protein n=1 Tax=Umezawaea endophytica TaxID=1654476 RepID=A0A9X2VT78_9PSEU|nr:hypothetical protein [Umezawaea endophytica]MCS7482209.1 hypothetical protein [Umezawaea endophytica]